MQPRRWCIFKWRRRANPSTWQKDKSKTWMELIKFRQQPGKNSTTKQHKDESKQQGILLPMYRTFHPPCVLDVSLDVMEEKQEKDVPWAVGNGSRHPLHREKGVSASLTLTLWKLFQGAEYCHDSPEAPVGSLKRRRCQYCPCVTSRLVGKQQKRPQVLLMMTKIRQNTHRINWGQGRQCCRMMNRSAPKENSKS